MIHSVVCQDDVVNQNFTVICDDKIATLFPYKSWYVPHGNSRTSAQAKAEDLTLNLAAVFASAVSFIVNIDNSGSGFDVLVNDHIVITYPYSGILLIGGLLASKTSAMASAYQLGQNLSSILAAPLHQH